MTTSLVDGFETWTGSVPSGWTRINSGASTVSQNSNPLYVTQGLYSAYVTRDIGRSPGGFTKSYASGSIGGQAYVDMYLIAGTATVNVITTTGTLTTTTTTLGASTIAFNIPLNTTGITFFITGNPAVLNEGYFDNFRIDDIQLDVPTTEYEISLFQTITSPDWLLADWNPSDWMTTGYAISDYAFIVDTVVPGIPTVEYEIFTYDPTFIVDVAFSVPTTELEILTSTNLSFLADVILSIVDTVEYEIIPSTDINVISGQVFMVPTTDILLEPLPVSFIFEFIQDYPVALDTQFDSEMLGVALSSVEGEGRLDVYVNGVRVAQDLLFGPISSNHTLSGIMVPRGSTIYVRVFMQNAYFRSLKADFALKRLT